MTFDGSAPEGLPGCRLDFALNLLGRPREQAAFMVLIPQRRLGRIVGHFREPPLFTGVTGSNDDSLFPAQPRSQFVPDNCEQPAAKRALLRVVLKPLGRASDDPQHLLRKVHGIGVLQTVLASEPVDQRRINLYELRPRLPVALVANADQQAGSCFVRIAHRRLSADKYPRRGKSYCEKTKISASHSSWSAFGGTAERRSAPVAKEDANVNRLLTATNTTSE